MFDAYCQMDIFVERFLGVIFIKDSNKNLIGVISFLLVQVIGITIFYFMFIFDGYILCIFYTTLLFFGVFMFIDNSKEFKKKYVSKKSLKFLGYLCIVVTLLDLSGIIYTPKQLTNRVNIGMYEFDHRVVFPKKYNSSILKKFNDYITYFVDKNYLNKAIQKDPNYTEAYVKMLKLNYNIQKYEDVMEYYEEKLSDELKTEKEILRIKINSLRYTGRDKEANELYNIYKGLYGNDENLFFYFFIE